MAEFDVEKDGGPLIIPVLLDPPRGRISGPPLTLKMLVDTGASHTVFHTSCRSALGNRTGEATGNVFSGTAKVETFAPPLLRIGPLAVRPKFSKVVCMDLTVCRNGFGAAIDGLLGTDVLSQLVFSIDFDEGRLRFHRAMDSSCGRPVRLFLNDGIPAIRAGVDGAAEATDLFRLDTGGVETMAGYVSTSRYRELAESGAFITDTPDHAFQGFTADRNLSITLVRAKGLSIAGYRHKRLLFFRVQSEHNCLCLGYLSRYAVAFDLPNKMMYLRPGKAFDRPDSYDLGWMVVSRVPDAMVVEAAHAGGAAAAAGFQVGDMIVAVNGHSTRDMALFAFRRVLHTEGRHVFRVRRGEQEIEIRMELKAQTRDGAERMMPERKLK